MSFSSAGWEAIEKVIREECPGDDEILAALYDLNAARLGGGYPYIRLYGNGYGAVYNGSDQNVREFSPGQAVAAIRSLIPRPEPTPEKDWAMIRKYVFDHHGEETCGVTAAINRLQEHRDQGM